MNRTGNYNADRLSTLTRERSSPIPPDDIALHLVRRLATDYAQLTPQMRRDARAALLRESTMPHRNRDLAFLSHLDYADGFRHTLEELSARTMGQSHGTGIKKSSARVPLALALTFSASMVAVGGLIGLAIAHPKTSDST